jgi:hypothetical protein
MNVFVVLRGEKSEGGDVKGVFTDELRAIECALAQPFFTAGPWQQVDDLVWESGCDFVRVEQHRIDQSAVHDLPALIQQYPQPYPEKASADSEVAKILTADELQDGSFIEFAQLMLSKEL